MKRLLGIGTLTLLLAGCGGPPTPTVVNNQTVQLGQDLSRTVAQNFSGTWRVTDVPDWVQVSTYSGTDTVNLVITADRSAATPVTADQPTLTGDLAVSWTHGSDTGTAHWTVTADQYVLTGQATRQVQVNATDIAQASATVPAVSPAASETADSVIVTYQAASTRDAVLNSALQAQSVAAQKEAQQSQATLQALKITESQREPLSPRSVVLRVPATPEVLEALRADPAVQNVTPSVRMHALGTGSTPISAQTLSAQTLSAQALASPVVPTDQYAPLQWAFTMLGYGSVWRDMDSGAYKNPVTVAVIDSGVRYTHPDLAGKLYLPGEGALDVIMDTANGDGDGVDTDPTDPSVQGRTSGSHGTHVTGIIVANWGNFAAPCAGCSTSGVVGASYKAPVKVLPIRVLDASGNTDSPEVINALRYAAGLTVTISGKTYTNPHPAQVINLSLGGVMSVTEAQPICDAVAEVTARGSLVVVAAGNNGGVSPFYPAACPGAVSVASVSLSGASAPLHANYSQSYAQVQLSAPGGTNIIQPTTYNGGVFNGSPFPDFIISTGWDYVKNQPNYEIEAGTSQATPQVSALAALLLSKGVTTGPADTLARMTATATDLGAPGRDPQFGYGLINPVAALNAPAVSSGFGVRLQDSRGQSYQPALDALGRFTAYLGDGSYTLVAGEDLNGNGIYGESGEPSVSKQATLGPSTPRVDLGLLTPP